MNLRYGLLFSLLLLTAIGLRAEKQLARMMSLPDKAITIDGNEDDWLRYGEDFQAVRMAPDLSKNLLYALADEGEYAGPADFFFEAWAAVDSDNLYLLAHVYDQSLFHDALRDEIYQGDDLEIFIDANSEKNLFAENRNENCRQIVLLADYLSNTQRGANAIWSDLPAAGIVLSSKIRPFGYVMEVKIPKAIFPNWKANPKQDAIGFDMTVNDADAPGIDTHHGPMKYVGYLLNPGMHFRSNSDLSWLIASPERAVRGKTPKSPKKIAEEKLVSAINKATEVNAEALAAQMLEYISSPRAGEFASAAIMSKFPVLRNAGLFIYSKRPELPAPTETIILSLNKPLPEGILFDLAAVNYALVVLAQRKALPVSDDFNNRFGNSFATTVRLTYAWCLGVNGDKKALPWMIKQMADPNMRIRVKLARSFGILGDPAALPVLQEMADKDHNYAREVAKESIEMIKVPKPKFGL